MFECIYIDLYGTTDNHNRALAIQFQVSCLQEQQTLFSLTRFSETTAYSEPLPLDILNNNNTNNTNSNSNSNNNSHSFQRCHAAGTT